MHSRQYILDAREDNKIRAMADSPYLIHFRCTSENGSVEVAAATPQRLLRFWRKVQMGKWSKCTNYNEPNATKRRLRNPITMGIVGAFAFSQPTEEWNTPQRSISSRRLFSSSGTFWGMSLSSRPWNNFCTAGSAERLLSWSGSKEGLQSMTK